MSYWDLSDREGEYDPEVEEPDEMAVDQPAVGWMTEEECPF